MSISIFFDNYLLFLMIAGTILNLLTLFTLCQPIFRDGKKYAAIHYMRAVAVFDILMLYGWNLNHYISAVQGWTPLTKTMTSCRIALFFGYMTCQVSAWLRVLISIDRYLLVTSVQPRLFNKPKTIICMILCVVLCFVIFNSQFLLVGCSFTSNGQVDINSYLFKTFPLWDYMNLGIYNGIPFILMTIYNSGLIYKLIYFQQRSLVTSSQNRSRSISITLLVTTCLFLIMTIPASIVFAFFYETVNPTFLRMIDAILYTYHILSFPTYFLTFNKFRNVFFQMIRCKKSDQRITPLYATRE